MTPPRTLMSYLQTPIAPWSSLLVLPAGTTATTLVKAPAGFTLRVVHGKKCSTPAGLFTEFARALGFPDYFGHNWDAMEECLADLEWLPAKGYILLLTDAQAVLADDEDEYETLLEILSDAGEAWSKGQAGGGSQAIAFHTLFAVSHQEAPKRKHWGIDPAPMPDLPPPTKGRSSRPAKNGRTPQ
ncbi:MAG: barstar family protein [Nitrospirota bacterium]